MNKVIAVFGISGVGKGWMISRVIKGRNIDHVSASELLKEATKIRSNAPLTSEQLRNGDVDSNQTLLINAFNQYKKTGNHPIIFDGHCLIDTDSGVIEIASEVIEKIAPNAILFLHKDTNEVIKQRAFDTNRKRPIRTAQDLEIHQKRARFLCQQYAVDLVIPFVEIESGQNKLFLDTINKLI